MKIIAAIVIAVLFYFAALLVAHRAGIVGLMAIAVVVAFIL